MATMLCAAPEPGAPPNQGKFSKVQKAKQQWVPHQHNQQGGSDEETTVFRSECGYARTRRATSGEQWPGCYAHVGAESNSTATAVSADNGQARSGPGGHEGCQCGSRKQEERR